MKFIGKGYLVGPHFDAEDEMVFEVDIRRNGFAFFIRENKPFTLDEDTRRCDGMVELNNEKTLELAEALLSICKYKSRS